MKARDYKPGDHVFWRLGPTAGEGMFVGRLKAAPSVLVLAIEIGFVEIDEADCSPIGSGEPPLGRAHRQTYLKKHPGTLK